MRWPALTATATTAATATVTVTVTVMVMVSSFAVVSCTGSDGTDDDSPSIGGINGPAVVDPSFDPFATSPSAPPGTDGG